MSERVPVPGQAAESCATESCAAELGRPARADEHRRELLDLLPRHLAALLTEPLGPLGLVGATGLTARRVRDTLTAERLQDFAQSSSALSDWDFGR